MVGIVVRRWPQVVRVYTLPTRSAIRDLRLPAWIAELRVSLVERYCSQRFVREVRLFPSPRRLGTYRKTRIRQ